MIDLDGVTADDFERWASQPFLLHLSTGDRLPLAVVSVARLRPIAGRPRPPFSVLFHADLATPVAQNLHRIEHPQAGVLELFIVPLVPEAGRARYQAVFA